MKKTLLFTAILADLCNELYYEEKDDLAGLPITVEFTKYHVRISAGDNYAKFRIHDTRVEPLTSDCTCRHLMQWTMKRFIEQLTLYME